MFPIYQRAQSTATIVGGSGCSSLFILARTFSFPRTLVGRLVLLPRSYAYSEKEFCFANPLPCCRDHRVFAMEYFRQLDRLNNGGMGRNKTGIYSTSISFGSITIVKRNYNSCESLNKCKRRLLHTRIMMHGCMIDYSGSFAAVLQERN